MVDLEEMADDPVHSQTDEDNDSRNGDESEPTKRNNTKRRRSKKRRNSGGPFGSPRTSPSVSSSTSGFRPPSQEPEERREEDEGGEQITRPPAGTSRKQDVLPIREDHQAQFYQDYHKVAEEYDRGFLKKHDEDLNTTLIFAGLFSAVAAAFITEVDPQLHPDPNNETHALLRILIYKIDNSTFGNDVPTLPKWTGPPSAIVDVQAILFGSLAVSLFSALLAMLGKQWLNRYHSADMRGTAIERSQNRQRKLDGIVTWYFDHVMESLPLMLQAALLLFGCALSRYLWEISMTVASVVLGVTSVGALFYLFIVLAGTAFESCPYQTPGAYILRRHILPALRRIPPKIKDSDCYKAPAFWWEKFEEPWYSPSNIIWFPTLILILLISLVVDIYRTLQPLLVSSKTAYHRFMATPLRTRDLDQHAITLDLRCVSWMLQTSLDKGFHLTAFKYLMTMAELACSDPSLILSCFNIFSSCVNVVDDTAVMVQGMERLAAPSATFFLRTVRHLISTDPTSSMLVDLRRRYNRVFPSRWVDFRDLPSRYTMIAAHILVNQDCRPPRQWKWWKDDRPSAQEHIQLAWCIAKVAEVGHRRVMTRVPFWMFRFVFESLSLDPLPPLSVVVDCLNIIAIDLRRNFPIIAAPDRSVQTISVLITRRLERMVGSSRVPRAETISALLPHAISLDQSGDRQMLDAIFNLSWGPDSWGYHPDYIDSYAATLLNETTPPSLNRATILLSPFLPQHRWNECMVGRWAAAVSAVPYSEQVGWSVVDTLLQLASDETLRPYIPADIWTWLKQQSLLPQVCRGRYTGTGQGTVRHVRRFGDLDTLKSYFRLVWSEWDAPDDSGFAEMRVSIVEDFGGVGIQHHRADLITRLDNILGELDRELQRGRVFTPAVEEEYARIQRRREQYQALKELLLEVGRRAMENLAEPHLTLNRVPSLPHS